MSITWAWIWSDQSPTYRLVYIPLALYAALHIVVLTNYTLVPESTELLNWLKASQWFIPTLLLLLLVPMVQRTLESVLRVRLWTVVGSVAVGLCVVLQLAGVSGLWWAWSTMGLLVLVVLVVANATKDRLGQSNAMLLGVMVMFLGMGSWEAVYQTGLWLYHDFFGWGVWNYYVVLAEQLTWVIPALIVMLVLHQRHDNAVRLRPSVLTLFAVAVAATALWFTTGMEIPLTWNGEAMVPVNDVNPLMITVSRASQYCWLVGIALLFTDSRKEKEDGQSRGRQGL